MKKLYQVDFGKPTSNSYTWSGDNPFFVVARSYDEAAEKAMAVREQEREVKSCIGQDGSLEVQDDNYMTVKAVKLVSENLIT